MANKLSINPLRIDTPGAAVLIPTNIKVKHIEFVGFASGTDSCIVEDRYGNVITELLGAAAGGDGVVRTGNIGWVYGIQVPTLTAGICLVFFE